MYTVRLRRGHVDRLAAASADAGRDSRAHACPRPLAAPTYGYAVCLKSGITPPSWDCPTSCGGLLARTVHRCSGRCSDSCRPVSGADIWADGGMASHAIYGVLTKWISGSGRCPIIRASFSVITPLPCRHSRTIFSYGGDAPCSVIKEASPLQRAGRLKSGFASTTGRVPDTFRAGRPGAAVATFRVVPPDRAD